MIELFFTACLLSSPSDCQQRSLVFVDLPLMVCITQAQVPLAKWSEENPRYIITRHGCRIVDMTQQET